MIIVSALAIRASDRLTLYGIGEPVNLDDFEIAIFHKMLMEIGL